MSGQTAYNVPAVHGCLTARIGKTAGFAGMSKCEVVRKPLARQQEAGMSAAE
jgi:hypothetical protein